MEENYTAIIIDDEKDICYLLSKLLSQKNISAKYVCTLKEAKILLENDTPSLIFLDNHLPDGLGVDFISNIKNTLPSTKIVMITAHDTKTDRDKALKEGADYFIGKPFSRDVIYQILQNCTG